MFGVELQVLEVAVAQKGFPLEGGLVVVTQEDGEVALAFLLEGFQAEKLPDLGPRRQAQVGGV